MIRSVVLRKGGLRGSSDSHEGRQIVAMSQIDTSVTVQVDLAHNVVMTLYVYGSIFVVLFLIYSAMRELERYSQLYNPRRYRLHGVFQWIRGCLQISEEEIKQLVK